MKAINWIPIYQSIKSSQVDISFSKCGIAMASSGNINREIQLIIDVIDYKMFTLIFNGLKIGKVLKSNTLLLILNPEVLDSLINQTTSALRTSELALKGVKKALPFWGTQGIPGSKL